MSMDEIKNTFDPPLAFNDVTTHEVTLRESKVKDMKVVDRIGGSDLEKELVMVARLTGINAEDLETLSVSQYKLLQEGYASFFDPDGQS